VDPLSAAAGEKGNVKYPKGTRYWFLVEIRPESSPPAEKLQRIEQGPAVGFRLHEPGRTVLLLHNPTDQPAEVNLPLDVPAGASVRVYRENEGEGERMEGGAIRTKLQPHHHLTVVAGQR